MIDAAMSTTATKPITADELLAMGDIGRCELIYGELIMMSPAGAEHGVVASRFARYLTEFVEQHDLGAVFAAETGFKIEMDPDLVRAPDASFVRKARLTTPLPRGFFPGVPDLAVEVNSPEDTKRRIAEKINTWLVHGTEIVWEADPRSMTVVVHRIAHEPLRLNKTNTLDGGDVLPGFSLPLAKVFKNP
jgi:Uma2 family endonuclease